MDEEREEEEEEKIEGNKKRTWDESRKRTGNLEDCITGGCKGVTSDLTLFSFSLQPHTGNKFN